MQAHSGCIESATLSSSAMPACMQLLAGEASFSQESIFVAELFMHSQ
jgi:hypothetical protein